MSTRTRDLDLTDDPRRISSLTPPRYRGVLHSWCAPVAAVLGVIAVVRADGALATIFTAIYMFTLALMFTVSATYHRRQWTDKAWWRMRNLDITVIYLLIAGGFTGLAAIPIGGGGRVALLAIVWGATAIGVIYQWTPIVPPFGLVTGLLILIGLMAVPVLPQVWRVVSPTAALLIIIGGVVFVLGALALGARKPDPWPETFGYHEIWHVMVAVGAGLHYWALVGHILPHAAA